MSNEYRLIDSEMEFTNLQLYLLGSLIKIPQQLNPSLLASTSSNCQLPHLKHTHHYLLSIRFDEFTMVISMGNGLLAMIILLLF